MFKMKLALLGACATVAAIAAPANATTLTVGGGWATYTFGGVGSSFSDSFDFTLSSASVLKVTDAFLSGDQFEVSVFDGTNTNVFNTTAPGSVGDQIGNDYDGAFADSRWSHLSLILGPGTYTVSGTVLASPFGSGGAAISLDRYAGAVPEPTTWAMMLAGFGAVGFAMRRRQKVAVSFA